MASEVGKDGTVENIELNNLVDNEVDQGGDQNAMETDVDEGQLLGGLQVLDANPGIVYLFDNEGDEIAANIEERMQRHDLMTGSVLEAKRMVFKDVLGWEPIDNPEVFPVAAELFKSVELRRGAGKNAHVINGLKFDGKDIIVQSRGEGEGYVFSVDSKAQRKLTKFNELVKNAKKEYNGKSLRANVGRFVRDEDDADITITQDSVDERVVDDLDVTDELMGEVNEGLVDALDGVVQTEQENMEVRARELRIPFNEMREIRGVLELGSLRQRGMKFDDRMEALDKDIEHWDKKSVEDDDLEKRLFYKSVARVERLTKDYIRVRNGLKPESDEALGILKEVVDGSDQLRLERLKRWAKKNMVGLSTGVITVAALITSIVMGARGAIRAGAQGLGKFAKAVARVFKKMGPLFSALGTVISAALSFGAKGVLWLASNLWILAVAFAVVLYNKYTSKTM